MNKISLFMSLLWKLTLAFGNVWKYQPIYWHIFALILAATAGADFACNSHSQL